MKKNKVVHDFGSFFDDVEKFEQERKAAGRNNAKLYRSYSTNMLESNVGDPYSPANIQNQKSTEDGKSWYENVFDFIKTGVSNVGDFVTEDIPNSLRMLDERINEGHVSTTESRMADNNDNKNHLVMVQEYLNLIKYYRELLSQVQASGGDILYKNQISQVKDEIDKYDQYFKTEGKNNPVVSDLLYNNGELLTGSEEAYAASKFIGNSMYTPNKPESLWSATKGLLKTVANFGIAIGKGLEYGYTQAFDRKGFAEDVVQQLDENKENDKRIIDKLYNGQNINVQDVQERLQYWNMHTERLDNLYDRWYKYDLKRKQEGLSRLAIPFTDKELLIDTSDPEDVPEEWRAEQQVHAGEFWSHPLYTLPEVGSTIGLGAGMVGTIVADGIARLAIRELPALVLTPEAKLLKLSKLYKSPQLLEKAMAKMEAAKAASKSYQLGSAAIMSADISAGLWLTKESRRLETAQEAAEAQKQRLIQILDKTNADPYTVYSAIVEKANQKGIDISNMKPDQLIGLALAYDIDTGDPEFDSNKRESRKGLMKLINANNALAAVDYIAALPFVSYGTRVLSDFGKVIPNNIFGQTVVMPRFTNWKTKGLWKSLVENYKTDVSLAQQLSRLTPELQQTVLNGAKMQAAYDGRVFEFAKNLIKKDHKVLGMMADHAAKWAVPAAKKYGHVGFFEGIEEGQQEILQKRYQRGEYDDYQKSYSMFDIPEVFNNVDLAKDVIKAWFGIGTEDIHDIRKASLIGASASMFFPFIGRAATSLTSTHSNHFLNLIKQLNTDWAMRKMISDNYKEIHDHNHLSMYYDMFRRGGVDNIRLRRSLDTLKASVDENSTFATPEYIDDDIQLMENVYTAYKDDQFAKNLAANGIKKFSSEYKTAVINYGRALQDLWEDNRGILKADEKKNEFETSVYSTIKEYINPNTTEERKKEIKDETPEIDAIVTSFKKLYAVYKTNFEDQLSKDRKNAPGVMDAYKQHLESLDDEELLKDKAFKDAVTENLVIRGIIQQRGLKENDAIIKARMLELRNDENEFQRVLDNAVVNKFRDQIRTLSDARAYEEDEYIERLTRQFNLYQQLKRAEGMLLMFKDQEKTQKQTRLITGRDIKTDKLRGMIDGLNDLIKALKEEEKEMFGKNGELVKMFENLNLNNPNQEQYNKIIDELLLFTSISNPHRKVASAYMYDKTHGHEQITPQQFMDAIFGDTVRVADPLYNRLLKLTDEYKQLVALQQADNEEGELNRKQGSAETADLFSVEKRAAMSIVMEEMNEAAKRIRIAHKLYEEDAREQLGEVPVEQEPEQKQEEVQQEEPTTEKPAEETPKNILELDPSLGEDSIVEILDNEGEETKRKKEALRRMEEREKKKKESASSEQPSETPQTPTQPETPSPEQEGSEEKPAENQELEAQSEPQEIILTSIPIVEGTVQRVNINGQVYEIKANLEYEKEDDETKNNVSIFTLSAIPNHFYSVYTDILGEAYEYSGEDNVVKNVVSIMVVRPHSLEGSLNAPIEIDLLDKDANVIGYFIRTEDSSQDLDEPEPIIGGEDIPDVDGQNDFPLSDVTGEEQQQIPDVTGEGLEEAPIVTGEDQEQTPIITGEGQEEAPIVEGGSQQLTIDQIGFDDIHGFVDQFGVPLTDKEQESLANQDSILADIDFYRRMSAQFEAPRQDKNGDVQDEGDLANYFAQTLFYDPEAEKPIDLSINSKNIKLKYPLRSGKELAKKLLDHDWLQKSYKYFVVTQAQDAAYKSSNDPDSFTVTLIIEDEAEKASYAISYRQLGKYISKGTEEIDGQKVEREYFVDHEQERRDFLLSVHGEGKTTYDRIRNYKEALYTVIMERKFLSDKMTAVIEGRLNSIDEFTIAEARRKAEEWLKNTPTKRDNESIDSFNNRKSIYEAEKAHFIELARDRISRKNRKKISVDDIEKQIQKLRENRMIVINKYLEHHEENGVVVYKFPSPEDTKRTVIPESIVQSNGKFDNQKDGEVPVVNNITKENNSFGVAHTTEEISRQIRDNEIVLGVGSGDFRTNEAYTINDFRRKVQWKYDITRGGIAGKIYLIIDTPNGNQVPLMLLEQRFDKQHNHDGSYNSAIQSSKLKLCLNVDGSIIDESVLPSAAEVLLYLLTGNITSEQFGGLTKDLQTQFANLFVNNGERTILKDSRVEDKVPQYAAKQLQVIRKADGKNAIIIGLPVKDENNVETGKYRQTYISNEELFDPADDSKRKEVVQAIARQMHWNTDRDTMANTFGGSTTNLILQYLENYFKNNPQEETYSLYGVPEFTFNKHDLFNVDETGTPISSKNDVYVMSWMLKTGKLFTDVSDNVFKDPWVFVGTPKSNSSDTILTGENNAVKTGTGDIDINETIEQQKGNRGKDENKQTVEFNLFDEEKYKNLPGLIQQKKVVKETPLNTLPKKILLADPKDPGKKYESKEEFAKYIKTRIEQLAKELNDSGLFSVTITIPENIEEQVTKGMAFDQIRQRYVNPKSQYKLYPIVNITSDGKMFLQHSNYQRKTGATEVNGVYQAKKTGGFMNREKAMSWLNSKLGIDDHDVLVSEIAMKSVENGEDVFGVMNVVFDNLRDQFVQQFILNPVGGKGLHYHEAWHYVNLLLHDTTTQRRIFDAYANSHPEFKGAKQIDIEEALAEEFREWMELRDAVGFKDNVKGIIKRFFYAVADMLHISGDKAKYRAVFRAINSGSYKKSKISEQSLKEFQKFYKNGVYSIYAPGHERTVLDNISKVVANSDDFYSVLNALTDYVFQSVDIRTENDLRQLCSDNFPSILEDINILNQTDDISEDVKPIIKVFLDNPEALRYGIIQKMKEFGIITKKDSISNARRAEEDEENEQPTDDNPWNIFDRFQFTVSKKVNSAFLAKLFLHMIPEKHWVVQDNGTLKLEDTPNPIIPIIPQYMAYDEVWNRLQDEFKNLNNSWGVKDKDGNYERYSFRGIVKKQVELNDPLFATIDELLDDYEDDTQLKAALVTTLNSQKPNISQFQLLNRYRVQSQLEKAIEKGEFDMSQLTQEMLDQDRREQDAFCLADRNKQWKLLNDNTLRASRSIPRTWSNRILSYGLIDYKNEGKISKAYYNTVKSKYDSIIKILDEYFGRKTKKEEDRERKLIELKDKSVDLLSILGVNVDLQTLNFYIYARVGKGNITPAAEAKEIRKMFSFYTPGTFGYVINLIKNNTDSSDFSYIGRKSGNFEVRDKMKKSKEIDQLFTSVSQSSVITRMALAKFAVHPGSAEYGVVDANGNMLYPTSQNSFISSKQRLLNTTGGAEARQMLRSAYAKNSLILNLAKTFSEEQADEDQIKFNVHVGLRGKVENTGADYFGITSIEDYIIKMILLDQDPTYGLSEDDIKKGERNNESTHLILPIMADKKTYGDFSHRELRTAHDPFVGSLTIDQEYDILQDVYYSKVQDSIDDYDDILSMKSIWIKNLSEDQKKEYIDNYKRNNPGFNRFSETTLNIFANYFLDELNALIQYYSKKNIQYLLDNPTKRKKNFHGKVWKHNNISRIDFSGNGGLFRYFYDSVHTGIFDTEGNELNLNQKLEMLYNLEKQFIEQGENSKIKLADKQDIDDEQFMSLSSIDKDAESLDDLDGFELIRQELLNIKDLYFQTIYDANKPVGIKAKESLLKGINDHIVSLVEDELDALCDNPNIQMAKRSGNMIIPVAVPSDLLERQFKRFKKNGLLSGEYTPYSKSSRIKGIDALLLKSLVANHVANTAISIIEFEKVFQGDPSYFKYQYVEDESRNREKKKVYSKYTLPNGQVVSVEQEVSIVSEKETDKIKRLGSLLSPGDEQMLSYTEEDYEKYKDLPRGDKFTNMVISDINASSRYIEDVLKPQIKKQLLINYIRKHNFEPIQEYVKKVQKEKGENEFDLERAINQIYFDFEIDTENGKISLFDYLFDKLDDVHKHIIEEQVKQKTKPYSKINVSDAQVFIRPQMYRKLRIGLGKWTDEDEEAFWILETDASWMSDPEKSAKVQKLELFPLKMAYYSNDPEEYSKGDMFNTPTLGKQAIFPWFKYQASSEVGMQLYNRMNKNGSEIDFLSFDSAVKVGAPQEQLSVYQKGIQHLGQINPDLDKKSNYYIDKKGIVHYREGNTLPVLVQDLKYLRYQLNTQAHKTHERAIGTQMFKIAFSNIDVDAMYGLRRKGVQPILGKNLRRSIMRNISLLTKIGAQTIESEFYKNKDVDRAAVQKWTRQIIENNDLGSTADEIIKNGFVAESLMNRKTFEQAVSKLVNKEVVDITTNGGTAVQQSAFGFDSFDGSEVDTWDGKTYHQYNDGKGLKWITEGDTGVMQVFLGMNFFKAVVPEEFRSDYKKMRDWLVEHNIIGDNSKPFGLGYRIPTQGQSSIFTFQVADVLPEQQGDVIVVPYEFTAQTGSDFDVDKLFLATFSYTDGQLDTIEDDLYKYYTEGIGNTKDLCKKYNLYDPLPKWNTKNKNDHYTDEEYYEDRSDFDKNEKRQKKALRKLMLQYKGAIQNRLLQDYITVISDTRMFTINRGSIDVISDAIHDDVLSWLKPSKTSYQTGMYELTPSYQAMKKLEFSVGKNGISIFALNITNLALTQFSGLTLDYGDNPYELGALNEITGADRNYTADWLSAMINACVDVAKDPYIFILNINESTFDTAAFLLRAGKGISTFTFLAQPILKQYAAESSVSGGIYGNNITGYETMEESKNKKNNTIKVELLKKHLKALNDMKKEFTDEQWKNLDQDIKTAYAELKLAIEYNYGTKEEKDRARKQLGNKKNSKKNKPEISSSKAVFDFDLGKESIQNYNSSDLSDKFKSYVFQIKAMKALMDIDPYVRKMSELVQLSQIDTKKFGNDIVKQLNYEARMKTFKYNSDGWIINTKKDRDISRKVPGYALGKYYSTMFLEEKFNLARKYTKELLATNLLVGTDAFEKLFVSIAKELNGIEKYEVPKTKYNPKTKKIEYVYITTKDGKKKLDKETKETFKPFYNEDSLEAISQAINNIARFNIVMNYGIRTQGRKLLPGGDYVYSDPIDFSYGGDFSKLIRNVHQLLFGDSEVKSLPSRVQDFISNILKNPDSEDAQGLVEDGKLINTFLDYLQPMVKSGEIPIDRLLLNDSQYRTNKNKKSLLSSSWYSLLTHESENVRNLAKDIALYVYYTTYDTPSINSITDLIPSMFRTMYDSALKAAIKSEESKLTEYMSLDYFTKALSEKDRDIFNTNVTNQAMYLDIICKNYWYNNDIVRLFNETGNGRFNLSQRMQSEWRGVKIRTKDNNTFSGVIVTTGKPRGMFSSPGYMKIRKGNETMLYKKIGVVTKSEPSVKDKKMAVTQTFNVYVAVQKAGLFIPSKNMHMFEFYANEFIPSLFRSQNILPEKFNRQNLLNVLSKQIEEWNEDPISKTKNYSFKFENIDEFASEMFNDNYNQYVYRKKTSVSFEDPIQNDRDLYFSTERKLSVNGHKSYSDVIVSVNKEQPEYEDKTIHINEDSNFITEVDSYISKNNVSGPLQLTIDSDIQEINEDGTPSLKLNKKSIFYPTKEEVDQYVDSLIDIAVEEMSKKNPYLTQSEIQEFREEQKKLSKQFGVERNVAIQKLATAIANIVNYISVKHPNISIRQLRINGLSLDAVALIAVQKAQKDNIEYKMAFKVDRLSVGTPAYKDFLNLYKANITINEEDIFSEDQMETPQEGVQKLLEQYIPEVSEDEEDENLIDDEDFDFDIASMVDQDAVLNDDLLQSDGEEQEREQNNEFIQNEKDAPINKESNNTKNHEGC